jgi:hypothetical protein
MKKLFLWVFICCFQTAICSAQDISEDFFPDSLVNLSRPKYVRLLEVGMGAASYKGDLATYQKWSSLFHIGLKLNKGSRFSAVISLGIGFIVGENRFYTFQTGTEEKATPNIFFKNSIFTLHYELQYNFIKTRNFAFYLSQGIGIQNSKIKDELGQVLIDQQNTRAKDEIYSNVNFMLPTSLGVMYLLKNGFGVGFQTKFFNTQTDYLDNISLWGNKDGNDNIFIAQFSLYVPLEKKPVRVIPPKNKQIYSHL